MRQTATSHAAGDRRINPWIVAMTVTLATFMEVLDSSIANVALPHIAGGLGATPGRGHLGADRLSGRQRHHSAGRRLHDDLHRAQEVLHDLRRAVRHQLRAVRLCPLAADPDLLPRAAGRWRRRPGTFGTGDPRRHLPAGETRAGLCDVWPRRGRARRPSAPPWAARSPTTSTGAGSSSSTSRSACSRCSSPRASSKIRPRYKKQVEQSQKGGIKLDFLGFGLLGLTFGSLEFILDKGQEDDWFSSHLITFFYCRDGRRVRRR